MCLNALFFEEMVEILVVKVVIKKLKKLVISYV